MRATVLTGSRSGANPCRHVGHRWRPAPRRLDRRRTACDRHASCKGALPMKTHQKRAEQFEPAANSRPQSALSTAVHAAYARRAWAAAVGAIVTAAMLGPGCSSDDGEGEVPAKPVALEDYCDLYAEMGCAAAQACDCFGDLGLSYCQSYLSSECQDEVVAPVEAGRMGYDGQDAGRCLTEIQLIIADCSLDGDDYPQACDRMLTGLVVAGDSCDSDEECAVPLECVDGICTLLPGDGEACLSGWCADDHSCGDDGICHRYALLGGSCAGGIQCQDGLYCNEQGNLCEPYLDQGDSCAQTSWACDDDLYCSPSSQTCERYPGVGQSCADSSGTCLGDAYCDPNEICRAQSPAGSGCSDDQQCLSYDCVDATCQAEGANGCPFL